MGQITIDTPQGPKTGIIAGNTPTEQEINKIKELYPASEGESFNYRVITADPSSQPRTKNPDEVRITGGLTTYSPPFTPAKEQETTTPSAPVGEVTDSYFRFLLGRMDDDEEKQNLLNQLLGVGTSERIAEDTFIIDQSKINPQIRERFGFADEGKIYLDKPGLTLLDFADFGGEAGPEVLTAMGAAIAASGLGWLPGMAMVGGAAAFAKAADEAVEWAQGLNRQSAGEVAGMIATSGVTNALGDVGGRLLISSLGRVIKGGGADVAASRVEELTKAYTKINADRSLKEGFMQSFARPKTLAKRAAKEEASANMLRNIRMGARPTVEAAAGKGLSARAQAIYEKLFKNPSVGQANVAFINKTLQQMDKGILNEKEAVKLLTQQQSDIANQVAQRLADPEQAFALSQQHLKDIVAKELAEYTAKFNPSKQMPEEYADNLILSATLFRTEANNMYDIAQKTIGEKALYDISPIVKVIDDLAKDQPFVQYTGSLFGTIQKRAAEGKMGIGELQQLRSALYVAKGDPELVSSASQGGISKLISSVADLMKSKQIELAQDVARGFRIEKIEAGALPPSAPGLPDHIFTTIKPRTTFRKVEFNPTEMATLREGLDQWDKANAFYKEGQERFNNAAVNTILKNAKNKSYNSNIDVVKNIVEEGNAPKLAMYLAAVTPSQNMVQKLSRPGATDFIEQVKGLVDADDFRGAEELVKNSGLEGVIPKIQGFMDDLPANDVFRKSQKQAYLKELDGLSQLSRAGTNPAAMRESIRNGLAKTWIDQTKGLSDDTLGGFNPSTFADEFKNLGPDLQNVLFGKTNAASMREAMETFKASAITPANAQELFDSLPNLTNVGLKEGIENLQKIFTQAASESDDAVLASIKSGKISNPLGLVDGVLGSPSSYNRLKNVVGADELGKVGGLQDTVINNLLHNGVKGSIESGTVQSGAWGKSFKAAIENQNKNGALNTILGADTVAQLTKLADDAVKVSDAPIAGFGGLVQASLPLALLSMVAHFDLGAAATTAGTMVLMSRFLRNPGILKLLTSQRVRSREFQKAVEAGADLSTQQGPVVWTLNRGSDLMIREASLIASSGILGEMTEEGGKQIREEYRKGREELGYDSGREQSKQFPRVFPKGDLSVEELFRRGAESGNVPGAEKILREIEKQKLMGQYPTQ